MKSFAKYWVLAAVAVAGMSCEQIKPAPKTAGALPATTAAAPAKSPEPARGEAPQPPAKVEKPLLLLDDEPPATAATVGADNSRCQVCHINLAQEELALTHAKANIGCAGCHGASDEHIADESWASGGNGTAPEKMFPRDKINAFCVDCHKKEKLSPTLHQDLFEAANAKTACVDCHGKHRLVSRKCKWK